MISRQNSGLTAIDSATDQPAATATKLARVRELLASELAAAPGANDACLTCSFQAEDVLLLHLVRELRPGIPVLFLDTGYHFAETYAYRDRIATEWSLNLINLLPAQTVAEKSRARTAPSDRARSLLCSPQGRATLRRRRQIQNLAYRSPREQARSRAALEEIADFTLPGGVTVRKLSPFADWTTRDIWQTCALYGIPLLPLYDLGYSSIGCEPCTSIPTDPGDPRSGRWAGRKVECGIHIQATTSNS